MEPVSNEVRQERMLWMKSLFLFSVIFLAGVVVVIFSGFYNVGATDRHIAPVEWVLRMTMENSVRWHARNVQVPGNISFKDPAFAERAIGHYSVACATCHGSPGQGRSPWMVTYPEAPLLTQKEVVARWNDAELFWLIKNGVKDTGMLALGPTHSEEDIWAVTAFVRRLPEMTSDDYEGLVDDLQNKKGGMREGAGSSHHHK